MKNSVCLRDLIDANQNYQYLTDKLEIKEKWLDKTLEEISSYIRIEEKLLNAVFLSYDGEKNFPVNDVEKTKTEDILYYLEYSHEWYMSKKLPEIEQSIRQLCKSHHESHPLLVVLGLFFIEYKKKLEEHIRFEEKVFFPYVKNLLKLENENTNSEKIITVLNQYSVKEFIGSHSDVETDLQEIRKTILTYSDEGKAPLPYRIFLSQLQHFENDLCRHALLEDGVLIPRVIELEAKLLNIANNHSIHPAG